MRALVLSGGGAHGAYEAGVAKALLERESFDLICGVSIGAINAALIAAGASDGLERFWERELPAQARQLFPHVPRLRRLLEHVGSLGHGGSSWSDALRVARAASEIPFLRNLASVHKTSLAAVSEALSAMVDFANLRTPLLMGATNVTTVSAAVFRAYPAGPRPDWHSTGVRECRDLDAGTFVRALLASSAMPGLFAPIELTFGSESAYYADGCLVHTSPLGLAIEGGANEVTVLFVDPERRASAAVDGVAQMAYNIATLWQQRMMDYEMRLAEATNEIVRRGGAPGKRQLTIRYVRPAEPLDLDMLAFDDAPALARTFALGVADGNAAPLVRLRETDGAGEAPRFWESLRRFPRKLFGRGEQAAS